MSDTENPTIGDPTPDAAPAETAEEKAKRARRSFPVQVWRKHADGGYRPHSVPDAALANVDTAERWVAESGEPAERYAVLRLVGVFKPKRSIEEVPA